jgi:hypothetical protein
MAASLEVLQLIAMIAAPGGVADHGTQLYHLATGHLEQDFKTCHENCNYSSVYLAMGDESLEVAGKHHLAERERRHREMAGQSWRIRLSRWVDDWLDRLDHS